MAKPFDIIVMDSGDVACHRGDFVVSDATKQHQKCLLIAGEGEYKENPATGVGIEGYLLDEDRSDLVRKIRMQFTQDNMNVINIGLGAKGININADYK